MPTEQKDQTFLQRYIDSFHASRQTQGLPPLTVPFPATSPPPGYPTIVETTRWGHSNYADQVSLCGPRSQELFYEFVMLQHMSGRITIHGPDGEAVPRDGGGWRATPAAGQGSDSESATGSPPPGRRPQSYPPRTPSPRHPSRPSDSDDDLSPQRPPPRSPSPSRPTWLPYFSDPDDDLWPHLSPRRPLYDSGDDEDWWPEYSPTLSGYGSDSDDSQNLRPFPIPPSGWSSPSPPPPWLADELDDYSDDDDDYWREISSDDDSGGESGGGGGWMYGW